MRDKRRMLWLVVIVALATVSCGSDVGDDGLPTHCGDKQITQIDFANRVVDEAPPDGGVDGGVGGVDDPAATDSTPFEHAVRDEIDRHLPRLNVAFPSEQSGGGSGDVHRLQVSDGQQRREASLRNANGVTMLKVTATVDAAGHWAVAELEVCGAMTKKFATT